MNLNSNIKNDENCDALVQIWAEMNDKKFLIGTVSLTKPNCLMNVDFPADSGGKVSLFIKEDYNVHLIGKFLSNENDWHITDKDSDIGRRTTTPPMPKPRPRSIPRYFSQVQVCTVLTPVNRLNRAVSNQLNYPMVS